MRQQHSLSTMIIILSGKEALIRANQWANKFSHTFCNDLDYDDLASMIERIRVPKGNIFITNLDCLNHGSCEKRTSYPIVEYDSFIIPLDPIILECYTRVGIYPLSEELINDAITHLVCSLRDCGKPFCLVGDTIPKNIHSMANLWVKCDNNIAVVLKSNVRDIYEGDDLLRSL
jgi:hypothetical protein